MFGRLLPYLRLVRFSNAPTAAADILAGFLLGLGAAGALPGLFEMVPLVALLAMILSSVCLYSWGMVLNDLFDYQLDLANRSARPLPAGEISLVNARLLAAGLIVISLLSLFAAVYTAGAWGENSGWTVGGPVVVFGCLAATIWLYDGPLKKTSLAPFVMGSCRGLNLLLGAILPLTCSIDGLAAAPLDLWICVTANTCFVTGLTWFARREEQGGIWWQLVLGLTLMLTAYAILALGLVWIDDRPEIRLQLVKPSGIDWLWPLAVVLVAFPVIRKAIVGVVRPGPATIKAAIIAALGNLVFINALVCLYADSRNWSVSLIVACLIIPITWLKQHIPPT